MKKYIDQIFDEGLGSILYKPLEKRILKFNNKKMSKFLIKIYKSVYFIIIFLIFIIILYIKLK